MKPKCEIGLSLHESEYIGVARKLDWDWLKIEMSNHMSIYANTGPRHPDATDLTQKNSLRYS